MRPARLWPASLTAGLLCFLGGVQAPGAEDVILLGAAVSLTGKHAPHGTSTKNGYELALRKINDRGGVKIRGKTYRLIVRYYDDRSNPALSPALAEQLIAQDGVRLLLGPWGSSHVKAMMPVAEKHKVPMVQAGSEDRDLFARGYRYHFAVPTTSDQYLVSAVHLAAEQAQALGKSKQALKIALAMEREALAQDVRAGVLEEVRRHGMMVVIDDQLPPDLEDMSATLSRVKMLQPDVLVISGREKGALTAVRQMHEQKVEVPIVAMTHCETAQITGTLGAVAEHVFCAQQWHRSLDYKDDLFGTAEDFAEAFEQTYQSEPPAQAAQSAAAVQILADALKRAQSLDPEAMRDSIAATELETFYGPVKFDTAGRNVAKPAILTQIQGGTHVVVAPAHLAKGTPIVPPRQSALPAE